MGNCVSCRREKVVLQDFEFWEEGTCGEFFSTSPGIHQWFKVFRGKKRGTHSQLLPCFPVGSCGLTFQNFKQHAVFETVSLSLLRFQSWTVLASIYFLCHRFPYFDAVPWSTWQHTRKKHAWTNWPFSTTTGLSTLCLLQHVCCNSKMNEIIHLS